MVAEINTSEHRARLTILEERQKACLSNTEEYRRRMEEGVSRLTEEIAETTVAMSDLSGKMTNLETSFARVVKIVDGNGEPPLQVVLSKLSTSQDATNTELSHIKKSLARILAKEETERVQRSKFFLALIGSLFAAAGALMLKIVEVVFTSLTK